MINMEETNTTILFYNLQANQYFKKTVNIDMSESCDRFLKYIVPGGKIIDIGAGSGRDSKYFKDKGFDVEAIDASNELCKLATEYSGIQVRCENIQDWHPSGRYDGIWANASLLHLTFEEIEEFMCRAANNLSIDGVFYASMKEGIKSGKDNYGRFFSVFSEETVQHIVEDNTAFKIAEMWKTEDLLNRNKLCWLNFILKKVY